MIRSHITKDIENAKLGIRPFILDVVTPDGLTSMLPNNLKMVLHANPDKIEYKYEKMRSISQTLNGYVEYYWGDNPTTLSLEVASGAFIRPFSGITSNTGPVNVNGDSLNSLSIGGTRRDTITYDKYLDLLALFHNNGSIYDDIGQVVLQGKIKVTFDGGTWFGWFSTFNVTDATDSIYQFKISLSMQIEREFHGVRSQL
jgi:hypothetical protein